MLKRITAIALCLILTASFTGCKSGLDNKDNGQNGSSIGNGDNGQSGSKKEEAKFDYTDPSIYTIDAMVSMGIEEPKTADAEIEKAADAKLKKIMDNPDTLKPKEGGKYIYVGNGGTDGKGYGLEPDKPFETIEYAGLVAKAGDVVLLRRGDFWRTQVYIKEGVSYGAYGKGNKPTIYGSTRDVASQDWEKVNKNIYKTQSGTGSDIGLLVFNHGKATGSKKRWEEELQKDFDFYCSGGYIYLYYSKGNPKNIRGIADLARSGMRYVNRQRGSGTRILMDYLCKKEGIDTGRIYGYEREEFTHTSVAAQIASGTADAGMGIYSAAQLYDLDFLPICTEQYDLLIPDYAWETDEVQKLIAVLKSEAFRSRLEEMGGYTLDKPGEVREHF